MPPPRSGSGRDPLRVGWVTSHPVQYQVPLLRRLGAHEAIDLTVLYLSDVSLRSYQDPGFGAPVAWDVDLSTGTRTIFLSRDQQQPPGPVLPVAANLERILRRERFDCVVVNGYNKQAFLRAMLAARLFGATVLHRGESHLMSSERQGALARAKSIALPLLFRVPHAFLSIGTRNTEYYRRYGVEPKRIHLAPYGVDNEHFAARATPERTEALRNELGLGGKRIILYASKLMTRKGPQHLMEAFRHLEAEPGFEDVHLVFVGDGEEAERIRSRATARTHLLGFRNQSELPAYYGLADVFVLPARNEAWGLAINEAMSVGTPCIVGETVGCAPDLVVDGVTGLTVPFGDPAALAERLRAALSMTWDRAKIVGHVQPFASAFVADLIARAITRSQH